MLKTYIGLKVNNLDLKDTGLIACSFLGPGVEQTEVEGLRPGDCLA